MLKVQKGAQSGMVEMEAEKQFQSVLWQDSFPLKSSLRMRFVRKLELTVYQIMNDGTHMFFKVF